MPSKSPYLGATLLWFPHADLNTEPQVGIVTKVNRQVHVVTLFLLPTRGGFRDVKHAHAENVMRISDDRIERDPETARQVGCWEWPEAYERNKAAEDREKRKDVERRSAERRAAEAKKREEELVDA